MKMQYVYIFTFSSLPFFNDIQTRKIMFLFLFSVLFKYVYGLKFSYLWQVGVTHYFSYLKAKEELGYVPLVSPREGMAATISYWQERKRRSLEGPTLQTWLFCIIGMFVLFCAAYLPDIGPVPIFRAISLFFLRSMAIIRVVFLLATAAHIGEAVYAWHLAKRVDPANARGWFWQTFALGIFSLRFLLKRAKK